MWIHNHTTAGCEANPSNGKIAKEVLKEIFKTGKSPGSIVEEKGLVQVTDTGEINDFIVKAIEANPRPVEQYKSGKEEAMNFLVGQVMKFSKGKANPQLARDMLIAHLKN